MPEMLNTKQKKSAMAMRLVAAILLVLMCTFKLFLSYKGLNQPDVMDQAQIARSVANGEGFSTKYYRPVELPAMQATNADKIINFDAHRDVNHAPLNIVSMAVALKITGQSNFERSRIPVDDSHQPIQNVYGADRTISAVSCMYFLLAMVLAYALIVRLFDDMVACSTICCLAVSELALDYAVSGLPQPLMLCCLLGALHFVLNAHRAKESNDTVGITLHLCISFVLMSFMCLSGWLSVWLLIGYLVFCASYFRPYGMYGGIGIGVFILFSAYFLVQNSLATGSLFGNAFYGIFDCFGGSSEDALRSVSASAASLDSSFMVLQVLGAVFEQIKCLYTNCCGILVAPFFCIALFFRYKKSSVECMKWALLSMWAFAILGMALYGTNVPLSSGQLMFLFTPLFVAYGFSILFNFIARLNSHKITFTQLRGLSVLLVVIMSAGAQLSSFPSELYRGVWLREKNSPHYPPYYPPALNCALVELTNEHDIIVTDQPWAVAWYANRKAVWLPKTIDDYVRIRDEYLSGSGVAIQGIVMTPSSYEPIIPSAYAPTVYQRHGRSGGLSAIDAGCGDFWPLALNLPLSQRHPQGAFYLNNFVAVPNAQMHNPVACKISEIVNLSGAPAQFNQCFSLYGAGILYSSRRR